jgi:hypothetical protein
MVSCQCFFLMIAIALPAFQLEAVQNIEQETGGVAWLSSLLFW